MYLETLAGYIRRPEKAIGTQGRVPRATSSQLLYEWEVVQRAQRLEDEALSWLYQLYYPKVYNYALLQLGSVQQAEDVASEVMLKVLESLGNYKFKGVPFAAWVFRIARNRIIDLQRRRKRRGEVDLNEAIISAAGEGPHSAVDRVANREQIQAALLHLTEEQRQVILLKFIEGFDNASIANVLGRSEGAVKSLQHRALLSLRRRLSEGDG